MQVVLDARFITEKPGGVARYAQSLIPELVRQEPSFRWVVVRHESNREPLAVSGEPNVREVFLPHRVARVPDFVAGAAWARRLFAGEGAPAIYHALFHIAPLGLRRLGPRLVVTLHDLIWVDHPHAAKPSWVRAAWIRAEGDRLFGRVAIGATLRAADHVISVSRYTADAATRHFGPLPQTVIPHGVDADWFEPQAEPGGEVGRLREAGVPYVMAVGNDKPYKNLELLIEAFARYAARRDGARDARLVIVGPSAGLDGAIAARGLSARVIRTGFLAEDELRRALSRASLFVFPSLVEGFGLPPLEAMALGVPTAVADVEPMRSVAGGGALRFDPRDAAGLAAMLERTLGDEADLARWSERGRARAAELTWDQTARETLAVYRAVAQSR